ncbi:hypothetical protein ES705_21135 [subsurface metagenome]
MKSSIGIFYQLTVRDKSGKVVRKTRLRRSRSFCLAFLQMIQVQSMLVTGTIKDVDGSNESAPKYESMFAVNAGAGQDIYGTQLGTGTTPVENDDFVMETKIMNGGGATQLNYGLQADIPAIEVGANVDYQLLRSFTNNSGGTIQVTEAGIYAFIKAATFAMTVHDVFTAVPVADGETITATYTFRTTV